MRYSINNNDKFRNGEYFPQVQKLNLKLLDMCLLLIPEHIRVLGYKVSTHRNKNSDTNNDSDRNNRGCGVVISQAHNIKRSLLQIRTNLQKLKEIIQTPLNYYRYCNIEYELRNNVYAMAYLNIAVTFTILEQERHRLIKEQIHKIEKSTNKVNKYYKWYILKPHLQEQERTKHYRTINMNNVRSKCNIISSHETGKENNNDMMEEENKEIIRSLIKW